MTSGSFSPLEPGSPASSAIANVPASPSCSISRSPVPTMSFWSRSTRRAKPRSRYAPQRPSNADAKSLTACPLPAPPLSTDRRTFCITSSTS